MYKTIIIKNSIDNCITELNSLHNSITEDGSIFCIVKTQYKNQKVEKDFMDVIEKGLSLNLNYINSIVIPEDTNMLDNVLYCVWFVKNKSNYFFNKDTIREKSIWKDVEWGKREKNYNSKGKDPGNVWIPTMDDGKAKITNHILLSIEDVYTRLLSTTLVEGDKYLLISDKSTNYKYDEFDGTLKVLTTKYDDINFGKYNSNKASNNYSGKVVFGTSELMNKIEDDSSDLVVTSPPYWDLKDYYKENQIGQESYEIYSNRMYSVWKQCYDKLKDDGTIWININIRTRNGNPILLPKLFVKQCEEIGFIYRGILIWHKSSGIPTSSKNLSDHHEYVLIFTKKDNSKINREVFNNYSDYKNDVISNKLFWNINRKAGSVGKNTIHPAIFPTELINRIIQVSTVEGDTVIDPFLGSGTTLIASLNNHRNCIGYEYYEGFKDLMDGRYKSEVAEYNESLIEYIY